jgi:hypothetical protein
MSLWRTMTSCASKSWVLSEDESCWSVWMNSSAYPRRCCPLRAEAPPLHEPHPRHRRSTFIPPDHSFVHCDARRGEDPWTSPAPFHSRTPPARPQSPPARWLVSHPLRPRRNLALILSPQRGPCIHRRNAPQRAEELFARSRPCRARPRDRARSAPQQSKELFARSQPLQLNY